MLRKLTLLILFSAPIPVFASICPASNAIGIPGIGDGCTTEGAEFFFPHVGIFKSTFTPACNFHDKCYTSLGADYHQCDSQFYEIMRAACNSKYNEWLQPGEWLACRDTAHQYYQAVQAFGSTPSGQRNMQLNARDRSILAASAVFSDNCGTTPERTTIYAPALITQIDNAFLAAAGRRPTIYEFFNTVNAGNIVDDRAGWTALLYSNAAVAAAVVPPSVAWVKTHPTLYSYVFTGPGVPGVSYLWKITQISATTPSLTFNFRPPTNAYAPQFTGFLKATSGGVSNMSVIDTSGWLIGTSCAPHGPPVSCE